MRDAFGDPRTFARFQRLACGTLAAEGRHTITAMMAASGGSQRDWSADYRVFSRADWEPEAVFRLLLPSVVRLYPDPVGPVVASLDDTAIRKSGRHIPGVAYRRDPMSPPFRFNLIRAQRFVQTSLAVPFEKAAPCPARAIPVGFEHARSVPKLPRDASAEQRLAHRAEQRLSSLSAYGIRAISRLREDLNATSRHESALVVAVDGSYTNGVVLKGLPDSTHLIGRIRKDAVLHSLPPESDPRPGRPRSYGVRLPTPDQIRQDETRPWMPVRVFAAGSHHVCHVKEFAPVLWRKSGCQLPLRLIIVRPLSYRRTKNSKLLYRAPAYLITTDLNSPIEQLLQAYFWRWDIEINHRDEKQLIGVGHAQVRSPRSVQRAPAFAVAAYAMLLIAAARTYGISASEPITVPPKWLRPRIAKQIRLSTPQLLHRFREDRGHLPSRGALPNFEGFASRVERHMKLPKHSLTPAQAIEYAMN